MFTEDNDSCQGGEDYANEEMAAKQDLLFLKKFRVFLKWLTQLTHQTENQLYVLFTCIHGFITFFFINLGNYIISSCPISHDTNSMNFKTEDIAYEWMDRWQKRWQKSSFYHPGDRKFPLMLL